MLVQCDMAEIGMEVCLVSVLFSVLFYTSWGHKG